MAALDCDSNSNSLVTGGHGTALGMVRSARERGREVRLYALETRPYNQVLGYFDGSLFINGITANPYDQGARLTTWECSKEGIPCTLLADRCQEDLPKCC